MRTRLIPVELGLIGEIILIKHHQRRDGGWPGEGVREAFLDGIREPVEVPGIELVASCFALIVSRTSF